MKLIKPFIILIALFAVTNLYAQNYGAPCNDGPNTSGEITVSSQQTSDGGKVVKIYDSDLDSLEIDSSVCFDASRWQNAVFGDSLSVYKQSIGATIHYKIRSVAAIGSDSILVFLLGKMKDEDAYTTIDTFSTNKATWYAGSFSIINAVTLGMYIRYGQ